MVIFRMVYICCELKHSNMNLDKKLFVSGLFTIISYTLTSLAYIWAVVDFLIYLVKDKEFNWWSVVACIVFTITSVSLTFISELYAHIYNKENVNKTLGSNSKYRSRFEQRMAEARREAEERRVN